MEHTFNISNFEELDIWNGSLTTYVPISNVTIRPYWKDVLERSTSIIITFNLILLMIGMGSATYIKEVMFNMKKPWGPIIGMVCQFGILPPIGVGLAIYFELNNYQSLGLLILCCSPGGAFSNFFAYWLGGDIALSILMTATSSLLAFGGMPLNMWIYSRFWTTLKVNIPYINILISMAFATGPALLGMFIRHHSRVWASRVTKICSVLGWIGALSSGVFISLIYWDAFLNASWDLHIAAALLPAIGFMIPFVISKILCFSNPIARTIGIETGCQNMVVAMNVMLISFPEPEIRKEMILFPMEYGIAQLVEVSIFIFIFQLYKYAHRNDVTEETVKSVIDNSVLMKVPTPLHSSLCQGYNPVLTNIEGSYADNSSEMTDNSSNYNRKLSFRDRSIRTHSSGTSLENVSYYQCSDQNYYTHDDVEDPYDTINHHRDLSTPLMQNQLNSALDILPTESPLEDHRNNRPYTSLQSSPSPMLITIGNPLDKNRERNARVFTLALKFQENERERQGSPRSPSANAGYGFSTFRIKDQK